MNRCYISQILIISAILLLAGVVFVLSGCNRESTEPGTEQVTAMPAPVEPVPEEPSEITPYAVAPLGLDLAALEREARDVRDQLLRKRDEIEQLIADKAAIPLTEQMGEEAKALAQKILAYKEDLAQLTEDLDQYILQLKEAGEDTSSLEMDE